MQEEKKKNGYQKLLTKSNYLLALQCHKLVHVKLYDKTRIPEPDDFAMHRFKTGDVTEAMAKTLWPNGIDIPRSDFTKNLELSQEYLEKRLPMFEPSFKFGQTYSRGDVLEPVGTDEWDIIEMKSATKVKDVNLQDVSFQKYVYENCGLKIRKCYLMYINRDYVKKGDIESDKLFIKTDITEEVAKLSIGIEERINKILEVINNSVEPSYKIGDHCKNPYSCPIKKECWADLPEGNILNYYAEEDIQCFDLGGGRIIKLPRVPDFYARDQNPLQKKMTAIRMGEEFEKRVFDNFFRNLEYPLYFLDLQTINPAVPIYDGMSPYKKIPFQLSLQVQHEKGGELESISFIPDKEADPRLTFLMILKENLGTKGTVLTYDKTKEQGILRDLVWNFKEYKDWIMSLNSRIKDIWGVLENFHYYDIDNTIKTKIKYKIPKLNGIPESDLKIRTGVDRGLEFEMVNFLNDNGLDEEEKEEIMEKIKKEGLRDVRDMKKILDVFYEYKSDQLTSSQN